jgi:hypothetical protein
MISIENRYFNRKNAISVLIGITYALLSFNAVFNTFYCYGVITTDKNLTFFRYSYYLLLGYIFLFIVYRISMRFLGFSYPLVMCFTSISFLANLINGYILGRASYSWTLNYLIDNPLGFEQYLRRACAEFLQYAEYILLAYAVISLLPTFRRRPVILGRFWIFNLISPLLTVPPIVLIIAFSPEDKKIDHAYLCIVIYLTIMAWLSIRFFIKTIYYFILFPSKRRMKIVNISERRLTRLERRKAPFIRMQHKYSPVYVETEGTTEISLPLPVPISVPIFVAAPVKKLTIDDLRLPFTLPFKFEILRGGEIVLLYTSSFEIEEI